MSCTTGAVHTITLSEGVAYSFGANKSGQLGLVGKKQQQLIFVPTPVSGIPEIKQVSCGQFFTVCVDYEGVAWAFGDNSFGQLGNKAKPRNIRIPKKINDIPSIKSVSCGGYHTLFITNDGNLWTSGKNYYGQLFLNITQNQNQPTQTEFTNVSQVIAGNNFSFFQNNDGEIYGCGFNFNGQLGLGTQGNNQIQVSPIKNQPQNIIQICCGALHSLFLDAEGNVYSAGANDKGALGLGHFNDQCIYSTYKIYFVQSI